MQFEKDHYNISEGEDVEVSLVITGGTTSSSFDVILTALDGTATGEHSTTEMLLVVNVIERERDGPS